MVRIPEDPPDAIDIVRDGLEFRVGKGGDLSFEELEALLHQHERQAEYTGERVSWPLSPTHLRALLAVKKAFPGAVVEDWRTRKEREAPKPWEFWKIT